MGQKITDCGLCASRAPPGRSSHLIFAHRILWKLYERAILIVDVCDGNATRRNRAIGVAAVHAKALASHEISIQPVALSLGHISFQHHDAVQGSLARKVRR